MGLWSSIRGDVFGSLAGGVVSSVLGSNSAKKQAALQRQNWAYQQQNAHQFEVSDLKAAGLNPILSATNSQIAGMGSAPSISDNGVGAGVTNSITAALTRQANVETEKTKADIALIEAKANATNAKTNAITAGIHGDDISKANERYDADTANIKSDTRLKNITADYTSAKQSNEAKLTQAEFERIQNEIRIANEKLPYEIDNIVANSQNARSTASYMLSMVNLNAAKVKLTDKQREQLESDLTDPKKLMDKQFWQQVFNSKEEKFKLLRASYERGLSNDVYFNFYANSQSSGLQDANDIATIGSRLKYLFK
jgi:hypothetical protein